MGHDRDVAAADLLDLADVVISASASSSVVKRCGQNVARVPMRRFLMWGRKVGSLNGSKYSLMSRLMNIGSPPVKRMSDTWRRDEGAG